MEELYFEFILLFAVVHISLQYVSTISFVCNIITNINAVLQT